LMFCRAADGKENFLLSPPSLDYRRI